MDLSNGMGMDWHSRRAGQSSNILDLIMVNEQNLISSTEHFSPIGKSEHETLMFTLYTGVDGSNDQEVEFVNELTKGKYEMMIR